MPDANLRRRLRVTFGAALVAVVGLGGIVAATSDASAAVNPNTVVRVNQVAYVPGAPKQATLVSSSGSPVAWTLRNSGGATVASGQTSVKGADSMSGDTVHLIDFSSYDTIGSGYVLSAGGRGQLSVRHLRRRGEEAALRRAGLLLPPAQRHADPVAVRRLGVRPPGRTPQRLAQPGRQQRAVPGLLRLHTGPARRLVRRRRPRQIPAQRRHLVLAAAERVRADRHRRGRRRRGSRRQHPGHPGARQRRPGHPRRGALGGRVPAQDAGAGRPDRRRHGAAQGQRRELDQPAATPRAGRATAGLLRGDHRRHAQPGRRRRADGPDLEEPRSGLLRHRARGGAQGLRGGEGEPGPVRQRQRHQRQRDLHRQQRHRRVLLGGGGAVRDHRRIRVPQRPDRLLAVPRSQLQHAGLRLVVGRRARRRHPGHGAQRPGVRGRRRDPAGHHRVRRSACSTS